MFWSLILEPGKRYSSTVDNTFHLSMATLDVIQAKNAGAAQEVCPVQLEIDDQKLILCNLSLQQHVYQVGLDLLFRRGTKLTFYTTGKAKIHLTGYLIIEDDMSDGEDFSDESEDESMEAEDDLMKQLKPKASKVNQKGDTKPQSKPNASKLGSPAKRKLEPLDVSSKKKAKPAEMESSGDDDDESGDSYLDTLNMSDSEGEEDDDIDGEESEGEDEEDDTFGEFGSSDDEDDDESDESNESDDGTPPQQIPKKKQSDVKTPSQDKKAQVKTPGTSQKDGKQGKQSQPVANGTTPKSEKKNKNKNTPQQPEKQQQKQGKTPQQQQKQEKTPQQQQKQGKTPNKANESSSPPQKRVVEGGVIIEELKTGNGPVAKPGKLLSMYYVGRLKNNNRVFDQSNNGPGFKFRLGRQEVIKGWDVGIAGMKVGSKRRITCPPAMAYGSKGSAPEIPPNSTLVFDVELKSVN